MEYLERVENYATKDGFNSYILHKKDSQNVILIDPISFDADYYDMLKSHNFWVSDVILTGRWVATNWLQAMRAIYNPQIVRYRVDGGTIKTGHGQLILHPLSELSGQVVIYGHCLFVGALSIISQCVSKSNREGWQEFLENFTEEYYLFSSYGPPDKLSTIREFSALL